LTSTVGRTLHSIKSTIPLAALHQLEILLFLHRCPPSLTASAPSVLLITANLPTFMRPCVPTYLELSVSQLAAFGAPRPHNLKSVIQREEGSRVFSDKLPFVSPVTRPHCKPRSPCHFICERFATPPSGDIHSLYESGIHYEYNTFSLSQGLYHRLRHFRTDRRAPKANVGRVGGLRCKVTCLPLYKKSSASLPPGRFRSHPLEDHPGMTFHRFVERNSLGSSP
jgi:hypothetical protein